ncbi:MAG TPA: hypothetical protein VEK77_04440 [Gemmatimonadales bacterium]|nr:hypothetical protein [Gemmatimonadales bacterium]
MTRLATLALGIAAAVLGWSALNAWRIDDVSDRMFEDRAAVVTHAPADSRGSYALTRVLVAVEKDPFRVDRRRPAQRFLAAADLAHASTPVAGAHTPPAVELVGTAVSPDGGFAVCAVSGAPPRIVRVGQRVGDWTLSRVTQGAAEFATPNGTTVVIRIAKAGT